MSNYGDFLLGLIPESEKKNKYNIKIKMKCMKTILIPLLALTLWNCTGKETTVYTPVSFLFHDNDSVRYFRSFDESTMTPLDPLDKKEFSIPYVAVQYRNGTVFKVMYNGKHIKDTAYYEYFGDYVKRTKKYPPEGYVALTITQIRKNIKLEYQFACEYKVKNLLKLSKKDSCHCYLENLRRFIDDFCLTYTFDFNEVTESGILMQDAFKIPVIHDTLVNNPNLLYSRSKSFVESKNYFLFMEKSYPRIQEKDSVDTTYYFYKESKKEFPDRNWARIWLW